MPFIIQATIVRIRAVADYRVYRSCRLLGIMQIEALVSFYILFVEGVRRRGLYYLIQKVFKNDGASCNYITGADYFCD